MIYIIFENASKIAWALRRAQFERFFNRKLRMRKLIFTAVQIKMKYFLSHIIKQLSTTSMRTLLKVFERTFLYTGDQSY